MKRIYLIGIILFFFSCDKNKELELYTEYYHIEDGDTLSYVFIPNTFTPDWDGINDYFKIISSGISDSLFSLKIYNLNGELFFETSHPEVGWDGTHEGLMTESATYNYEVNASDQFGYEYKLEGTVLHLE